MLFFWTVALSRAPAGTCMNRDWFALPVQLSAVCVGVVHFKIHATVVWLPSFVVVAALASFVVGCACFFVFRWWLLLFL